MPLSRTRTRRHGFVAATALALVGGLFVLPAANAAKDITPQDVEDAFHVAEDMNEQVNQLNEQAKLTQDEIDDISGDIDRDLVVFKQQKAELGAAIVQQQMDAPLGPTVNLLGSGDPEQFLAGLGAVQALNSTRADALEQFGRTSKVLKNRRAQLEDRKADLDAARKAAAAKQDVIRKKYSEAKAKLARLTAAQQATFNTSNVDVDFEVDAAGRAKRAIAFALSQLGDPYVYGGTGPNGWDCSGLMLKSWAAAGVSLPRTARAQLSAGRSIPMSAIQPGDIVGYGDGSHDGMYLGNGRVVHSPRPGKSVEITGLSGYSRAARVG